MLLLGYAPGDKLPYSEKTILQALEQAFSGGKAEVCRKLIRYYKRKFQRDYLYDILQPILLTHENGVTLRIGAFTNPKGYFINASIHLCVISGDNKQLDYLAGTNFKTKVYKCRLCMSQNCNSLDIGQSVGSFRDDNEMQNLSELYEQALKQKATGRRNRSSDVIGIEIAKETASLCCGSNSLIKLFKWQYDRGISCFFKSLVPDYLHTVVKGVLEDAISWSMCCIINVGKQDKEFQYNQVYLDNRIKTFPTIHSLVLFPNKPVHRFHEGICSLFKTSINKKGTETTAFLQMVA